MNTQTLLVGQDLATYSIYVAFAAFVAVRSVSKGPYKRVLFFLEICQISRKFPRSDKNKNTRFLKAVVKYVGGFWPIGVFFAGYRSFFFVPSRQTQTKARL